MIRMIGSSCATSPNNCDRVQAADLQHAALGDVCGNASAARRAVCTVMCAGRRTPTAIVSKSNGSIAYANAPFQKLLHDEIGLNACSGRLCFVCGFESRKLRNLLQEGGPVTTALIRQSDDAVTVLLVKEIIPRAYDPFCRFPVIASIANEFSIVEALTANRIPETYSLSSVASAFGLTNAECRLLRPFAEGFTLEEIAQRRGLALGTVRQQMKSVLSKTGCRRQVELALLLARL